MKKISRRVQESIQKVQDLAEYRDRCISDKGKVPDFRHACHTIGLLPVTVKRHVPELLERWDDPNFRWKP